MASTVSLEAKAPDKSLYNDWEVSTEVGNELWDESYRALKPILQRYMEMGYPLRQIAHEMLSAVTLLESETCLLRNTKMHKEGRKPQFGVKENVPLADLSASKEQEPTK
jgi:hypothetical protein